MESPEITIAKWFKDNDFHWSLKDKGYIIPDEADVEAALDEAARVLYNEPVGSYLAVGRLIIEKLPDGHAVYMYVGNYE